ncbi:Allantoicase [Microbotryomycetes sp. JL221]|nr:Allantoicase [Microbotryomycetes sp. JL221]
MSFKQVPLDAFDSEFGKLIELSSEALGGSIVDVSDDFFASAHCLLRVPPSVSLKGQFGPNGALFDGWESRRHNTTYDWVIIKLGALGKLQGCDIDTGHFSGNESPASGVWGACVLDDQNIAENSELWEPLLPVTPLGPAQRHLFKFAQESKPITHVKLTMHPDGGIGRFRAYGTVVPPPINDATPSDKAIDLAFVLNGAVVVAESDQHFGKGSNLILPGRGKDMGDGWETKRSRGRMETGQGDWVIVKLAEPGYLEWTDIDTLHFVGNYPAKAQLFGINHGESTNPSHDDSTWTEILPKSPTGPHQHHIFQLIHSDKVWTHVKMCIYPDGGVKRLRLYGRRVSQFPNYSSLRPLSKPETSSSSVLGSIASAVKTQFGADKSTQETKQSTGVPHIPALPLTREAYSSYGSVIQAYPDERSAKKDIKIKRVNFGTASKYNFLSKVEWIEPSVSIHGSKLEPEINFCVFRCDAQNGEVSQHINKKEQWQVKVLERHEFSSQAFVPMGNGGDRYLVIVCLPNSGKSSVYGQPDLSTLRAFVATSQQGISYKPNVWHHPLIALDKATDFACVVYETGVDKIDCEIHEFGHTIAVVENV